jgi:hypothetical protein
LPPVEFCPPPEAMTDCSKVYGGLTRLRVDGKSARPVENYQACCQLNLFVHFLDSPFGVSKKFV